MRVPEGIRGAIRADGFVLLEGALASDEVAAVQRAVAAPFVHQLAHLTGAPPLGDGGLAALERGMRWLFRHHRQRFIWCGKHAQHALALHRLAVSPRLEALVRAAGLAAPSVCTRPVAFFNHPDLAEREIYWRVPAHQDWRSMQASVDSVVIWVPLVDVPTPLGPLEVVPGSHLQGLLAEDLDEGFGKLPDGAVPPDAWRAVPVRAGDLLLFSSFLVHRSGTNVSDRFRWSCHFRYTNLAEPEFVAQGFPQPYTYRPEAPLVFQPPPGPAALRRAWSADVPGPVRSKTTLNKPG